MAAERLNSESLLVSAAIISADLNEVSKIANTISIGVKNAKAIATRAGDRARGFKPITDFINEMAIDIMNLVTMINKAAINITQISSHYSRRLETLRQLEKVFFLDEPIRYKESLKKIIVSVRLETQDQEGSLKKHARQLDLLLDEIETKVKAAQVISSTSRVEASSAEDYRKDLEGVADNLEAETKLIKKRLIRCQHRIDSMLEIINQTR